MSPIRISPIAPASVEKTMQTNPVKPGFGEALRSELERQSDIKISMHAQKRLDERSVRMDSADQARLAKAMDKAHEKGADKSLVLLDNLALIVSAKNRVVITAVDSTDSKDGVFTGIDSAVIA